jgi:uncharacterized protein (TIGR02001 family)
VKKQIAFITAIATIGGLSAGSALALDVTANAGAVSEYVFRGVPSSDGKAAAQGGLDAAWDSGFYLGTWGSSVDFDGSDGVEVDFYGGYGSVGDEDLFDYSIVFIASDAGLMIGTTAENRLVFGGTKSFDINL